MMKPRLHRLRKAALCLFLILSMLFCLSSCIADDEAYYRGANWKATGEELLTVYAALYRAKLAELAETYGIVYQEVFQIAGAASFDYYLYNDEFVLYMDCYMGPSGTGTVAMEMVIFGPSEEERLQEHTQAPYLHLVDDFIHYCAYAVPEEDSFWLLYRDCLENGKEFESNNFYYDSLIGNLQFRTEANEPCLYEGERNYTRLCNMEKYDPTNPNHRIASLYVFKGLLKGLY